LADLVDRAQPLLFIVHNSADVTSSHVGYRRQDADVLKTAMNAKFSSNGVCAVDCMADFSHEPIPLAFGISSARVSLSMHYKAVYDR